MGNGQGINFLKVCSTNLSRYIRRKTRRYNVAPRAEKYLDKMKEMPIRAPNYESTMKEVERLSKEMPQNFDKLKEKDEHLYKNLEKVFVSSEGYNVDKFSKVTIQPSLERQFTDVRVFEEVPEGKFNIVRAQHFLAAHAKDPKLFNADVLSQVYKIDYTVMRNILKRVKLFDVALPTKAAKKPFLQRYAEEVMPKDMLEEHEVDYHERKMIEAKDLFDEFYKVPGRDKTEEIITVSDWSLAHILQGKLPTMTKEMIRSYRKKGYLGPDINEIEKHKVGEPTVELSENMDNKIVRPTDDDFDVFKAINEKKANTPSNVKSEQKEKVSDRG